MNIFENNIHLSRQRSSPLSFLLVFGLSLCGFYLIGPILGMLLSLPFYQGDLVNFITDLSQPFGKPYMKVPYYLTQGLATFTGTILIPFLYLRIAEKQNLSIFFSKKVTLLPIMLSAVIVVTFMGVNAIFIEWNAGITFPEFMAEFEQWAKETETLAGQLTEYLTTFDTGGQFIIAFVIIAILPAFGEELLFRGFIQNLLHTITSNIHWAIWIAAILFSAIHMQFYGFVPRMLLGALFGYLYYWSGNLIIPIVAHLVNNGLTLVLYYLHDLEVIETDISNTQGTPLYTALIFAIITAILLYYFRHHFFKALRRTP